MQKVVGSNPIIRSSQKAPLTRRFFVCFEAEPMFAPGLTSQRLVSVALR